MDLSVERTPLVSSRDPEGRTWVNGPLRGRMLRYTSDPDPSLIGPSSKRGNRRDPLLPERGDPLLNELALGDYVPAGQSQDELDVAPDPRRECACTSASGPGPPPTLASAPRRRAGRSSPDTAVRRRRRIVRPRVAASQR